MQRKRIGPLAAAVVAMLMTLGLPTVAIAQEATLTGTVSDTTGGVLPGVTITAIHQATGNTFLAVTDERGAFRLPVRTGPHRVTAELPGFGALNRTVDLLVNQQAVVNLQMSPSSVQESVTVTGEAPLIQTTSSEVGGNIDPRQMDALPVNGRNWLDLAILAPGSRQNSSSETLGTSDLQYQINVDGQQVTNLLAGSFGQPRYSRESMAEVQIITNRFDATQGRSSGLQMNAITKSGTNALSGSFSGYFRDDSLNAKDFIANRVLPYSNQQLAWTLGGPIRRDRMHYFGSYEYEREPMTFIYTTSVPAWNTDQLSTRTEKKGLVRLDYQASSATRLTFRLNKSINFLPIDDRFSGGALRTPASIIKTTRPSLNIQGTLSQVLGNSSLNEIRVGYAGVGFRQHPAVNWPGHPADIGRNFGGTPILTMQGGLQIGQGHQNSPVDLYQKPYSVRDDFTFSYNAGGRHDVKVGGEFIYNTQTTTFCDFCTPTMDVQGGPIPANIAQIIPNLQDPATWNFNALSPLVRNIQISTGAFTVHPKRKEGAAWIQNDWRASDNLTLNLGLRYDIGAGNMQDIIYEPFITQRTPTDKNNIAPRVGFAYTIGGNTVFRGGYGKYFAAQNENTVFWSLMSASIFKFTLFNDGRPDFAGNPFNGPMPTYEQALDQWRRGLALRSARNLFDPDLDTQWSHQASLGVQRQIGEVMSVTADWVMTRQYDLEVTTDVNYAFDLATGTPFRAADQARRPHSNFTTVNLDMTQGQDKYQGVVFAWQKRMSGGWQASATYSLSYNWNFQHVGVAPGCDYVWTMNAAGRFDCNTPVTLHPSLRDEWYRTGDQVHRATFNGIWDAPGGLQVSGLYFFGDNGKATPQAGIDPFAIQTSIAGQGAGGRLRADGTLVERNSFERPSIHRFDMRLQRDFPLVGGARIAGLVEVFNVFNHENYNSFVLNERNATFGRPQPDRNVAFQPRVVQLGFRLSF